MVPLPGQFPFSNFPFPFTPRWGELPLAICSGLAEGERRWRPEGRPCMPRRDARAAAHAQQGRALRAQRLGSHQLSDFRFGHFRAFENVAKGAWRQLFAFVNRNDSNSCRIGRMESNAVTALLTRDVKTGPQQCANQTFARNLQHDLQTAISTSRNSTSVNGNGRPSCSQAST
jgi:hypothetical protein